MLPIKKNENRAVFVLIIRRLEILDMSLFTITKIIKIVSFQYEALFRMILN